jgi:hypothetical protein
MNSYLKELLIKVLPCALAVSFGVALVKIGDTRSKIFLDILGCAIIWTSHIWYSYVEKKYSKLWKSKVE